MNNTGGLQPEWSGRFIDASGATRKDGDRKRNRIWMDWPEPPRGNTRPRTRAALPSPGMPVDVVTGTRRRRMIGTGLMPWRSAGPWQIGPPPRW